MKLQSDNKMLLVTPESKYLLICWNEREVQLEGEITKYEYDYARIPKNAGRGEIIDTIIRSRYSQSQMEAIINNYLRTDRTPEQEQEFNDMQNFRVEAHNIANQILGV